MTIRLLDYRATNILFKPSPSLLEYLYNINENKEDFLYISFSDIYPEDDRNTFFISFSVQIKKDDIVNGKEIFGCFEVDFLARFYNINYINKEFKESIFPKINAPAIAYPFLRSFVNSFFINSGYNSVLLPTYNFAKSERVY